VKASVAGVWSEADGVAWRRSMLFRRRGVAAEHAVSTAAAGDADGVVCMVTREQATQAAWRRTEEDDAAQDHERSEDLALPRARRDVTVTDGGDGDEHKPHGARDVLEGLREGHARAIGVAGRVAVTRSALVSEQR
jgi:hypothetical protein